MDDDPRVSEAIRHVGALKGFYVHLIVFCCVMAGLFLINLVSRTEWWVQWPMLGWGIGLIGHAIGVFAHVRLFGREWEQRKIRERLDRPQGK